MLSGLLTQGGEGHAKGEQTVELHLIPQSSPFRMIAIVLMTFGVSVCGLIGLKDGALQPLGFYSFLGWHPQQTADPVAQGCVPGLPPLL